MFKEQFYLYSERVGLTSIKLFASHLRHKSGMTYFEQASSLSIEQQHQAVLQCCVALLQAIGREDRSIIASRRAELAGLLHANLASEEAAINAPIRRMPPASRPEGYGPLSAEAAQLRARYSAHVGQWSIHAIANDAQGYERAVRQLVTDVRAHVEKKQALLPAWRRLIAG
ncbi:MAG: hypothetical protein EOO77_06880 [Oxalobacteraceae bacterium]|nr:MAG: hypothetical protein EOO77_06880 [Oxalobacteraceae bacterium]